MSASSLIRIAIDERYLLVRGNRIRHQFQPVGGVFKYFERSKEVLDRWGVRQDPNVAIDDDSRDDLRVRLPGKHVAAFLRWFDARTGRESEPWREFHEEVVATGLVDKTRFPHAHLRWTKRHETPLHWSDHFQTLEILVFDIYELVPTPEQLAELRRLIATTSDDYTWVCEDTIRRRGHQPGQAEMPISPTATFIL